MQQLVDLGEYIKRFKPREATVQASPDALLREVDEIRQALSRLRDEGSHEARRALAAKAASIHKRIEDARALAPDEDEDHDAFVDVEEQLWDLEALLGTRS